MRGRTTVIALAVLAAACTQGPTPAPPPTGWPAASGAAWQPPPGDATPVPVAWQQPPANPTLDALVAPIALYPDALVAQILPAATHPSQVVAAAAAVANGQRPPEATASRWDPSVQALLSYPTVLKMMSDRIDWTTRLGDAVRANQAAVMSAIQEVRRQAQSVGNLASSAQQTVQTVDGAVVIEPADPAYIYVPQYDPVAILAPWPPYAYGPPMTFGIGFAAGAATAYACHWGHGTVTVNDYYHYSVTNAYPPYHPGYGASYGAYHPSADTYTGYDAKTGTYGVYHDGHYSTYDPSTGQWNHDGNTGTYHGGTVSPDQPYHPDDATAAAPHGAGSSSAWGDHASWGSGGGSGGDAFHGMDGGGWGARDASARGAGSLGGGGFDGGGGGFDGGGARGFGGGGGFDDGARGFGGGGFGGFRGGGFGGRR